MSEIKSDLGWSTPERITVRGKDLPGEILGKVNLGDMAFLELTGRLPNDKESRLFNAMVVTLVEHGITPSALATRCGVQIRGAKVHGPPASARTRAPLIT